MLVKEEKERRGYQKQARQDKHEVPRSGKAGLQHWKEESEGSRNRNQPHFHKYIVQ
jgi:hypothetical protein